MHYDSHARRGRGGSWYTGTTQRDAGGNFNLFIFDFKREKNYTTLTPVNLRKVHNYSREGGICKKPRVSSAKGKRKNGKTSSKNFGKTKIYDDLICTYGV